jgi:hypothetical protein
VARVLLLASVMSIALVAARNHRWADTTENQVVEDYALNVLSIVEDNALILGSGDVRLFSIAYMQTVRNVRPTVQYVDVWLLLYPWYVEQQKRKHPGFPLVHNRERVNTVDLIARSLAAGRPVYLANAYSETVSTLRTYPWGPLRRVYDARQSQPPPPDELARRNETLFAAFLRQGRDPDPEVDPWSAELLRPYREAWLALADALARAGHDGAASRAREHAQRWSPSL